MTTSCSWNRLTALGSASRTLVSRTYVRRTGLVLGFLVRVAATTVSSTSPRAPCAGPTRGREIGAQGRASTHLERTAASRRFRYDTPDVVSQPREQLVVEEPEEPFREQAVDSAIPSRPCVAVRSSWARSSRSPWAHAAEPIPLPRRPRRRHPGTPPLLSARTYLNPGTRRPTS